MTRTRSARSTRAPLLGVVVSMLLAGACDRIDPPPPEAPSTAPSTTPVQVTGSERVVWDQPANNATQLAGYRYIVYVDDAPVDLVGASCDTELTNATMFPCSAALPKLSPGSHRLQLAAQDKQRRGPKSGVLLLDVRPPNTSP